MRTLVVLLVLVAAAWAEQFSYEGYKVYRAHPANEHQVQVLESLSKNNHFDFWSSPRSVGKPVDIMVDPHAYLSLASFLDRNSIQFEILIDNVERNVQQERMRQSRAPRLGKGRISFAKYNRHGEINDYIDQLSQDHSDIVAVETIGKSYEGRDLKVIKISSNPSAKKPVIFIDAGIHAREWAAPAQATYIINQLVENPSNSQLLDKVDWHILPVVNPDGYEYTHDYQRLWRKTRSRGKSCYGADANRNFGFHWGEIGASEYECDDIYMGSQAFSEVEAQAVRDYINKNKDTIKLYITCHSYGEYILFPWGFTSALPDDYDELQDLGELVANTIHTVAGTTYTVGTSTNVLYPAAGGSDDWAKGVAGVELSYTIELPGGGSWGFDPPPNQIRPIVEETWVGFKAYHHYVQAKFGK